MSSRITLRDVAHAAGCSTATVSMALHNSPRIPDATRQRVREIARQLGYRPDPLLSALAAHRWHRQPVSSGSTLAALADGRLEGEDGMAERAAAHGYGFEKFQIHDHSTPQRLAQVLYSRGILGVLVGQIFTPGFCAAFDWSRFVSVACSEGYERPPVHLVMPNHFRAVQDGWDRASAAGHRRIGLAVFDMPSAIDFHDRCSAFLDRQRSVPAARRVPVLAVKPEEARTPQTQARIDAWMRRQRPDIVMGFNQAFVWLLRDAGWPVPERARFLDLWVAEPTRESTGYCLHPDEVGRRAVDWLHALLRVGERGLPDHPITMSVTLRWQDGKGA